MARKKVSEGGKPNRPNFLIQEEKRRKERIRQWRAEHQYGTRGRLPKGVQLPSFDEEPPYVPVDDGMVLV